jgi:uncharacterized protein
MKVLALIVFGLVSGGFNGLTGMGIGVIIAPVLLYIAYSIHLAQGTLLALLAPPIGLLAVWACYKSGYVDVPAAIIVAIAFVIGSQSAARMMIRMRPTSVRNVFVFASVVIAANLLLNSPPS